jgi:hypothetical protein
MNWELDIERASNGYVCHWWDENINDELVKQQVVFEEANTEHGGIECFQSLLYFITEHFGMYGSKHDARRIRITTGGEDDN